MPLSKEGQLNVSRIQRSDDQEFQNRFGPEALREKIDREGVYAYGFPDEKVRRGAVHLLFGLSNEFKYGNYSKLPENYASYFANHNSFAYELWTSRLQESEKVLSVDKPFPKRFFDAAVLARGLTFSEVPVYRLGELSEEQILSLRGGVVWRSNCYIDLDKTVKRPV